MQKQKNAKKDKKEKHGQLTLHWLQIKARAVWWRLRGKQCQVNL